MGPVALLGECAPHMRRGPADTAAQAPAPADRGGDDRARSVAPPPRPVYAERALRALEYHRRLLLLVLERLDLPLALLAEFRLGCARRRPGPRTLAEGGGDSEPGGGAARWRRSPWGPVHLAAAPRCLAWRRVWGRGPEDGPGEGATRVGAGARRPARAAFSSCTAEEALLSREAEVHVCASLRHLARARELRTTELQSRRAEAYAVEPGHGQRRQPGCSPQGEASDGTLVVAAPVESEEAEDRLAAPESEGGQEEAAMPSDGEGDAADPFAAPCRALADAAWAFFLRERLVDAALRGDALASAAWALRLLGVAGPWNRRRLQEAVILALEILAEHPSGAPQGHCDGGGGSAEAGASAPRALDLFQYACAAYLEAPVIPRFKARLSRALERLRSLGLFGAHPDAEEAGSARAAGVARAVAIAMGEAGAGATPHQFDESGQGLESFRAADEVHTAFARALAREALDDHAAGRCSLDAQGLSIASAEAAMELGGGASWPEDERSDLLDTASSVPQLARPARNLADMEVAEFADSLGLSVTDLAPGIGLDDVRLDVGADMRDDRSARCGGTPRSCARGLLCGAAPPPQPSDMQTARRRAAATQPVAATAAQRKPALPAAATAPAKPPKRPALPGDSSPGTPPVVAADRRSDEKPSRFGT